MMIFRSVKDSKGQAIFEFIIFLPFLLILLSVMITISSSINGSINQQKITRGYFFYRIKGNSMIPSPKEIEGFSVAQISMRYIGWAEKMDGAENVGPPYTTCYKMTSMLGIAGNKKCDDSVGNDDISAIIKPRTVFGLCTGTLRSISDELQYQIADASCNLGM